MILFIQIIYLCLINYLMLVQVHLTLVPGDCVYVCGLYDNSTELYPVVHTELYPVVHFVVVWLIAIC